MRACRHLQSFDTSPKAGNEVIAQARLLRLVKKKPFVETRPRVFRNLGPNHGLPKVPFTESQSRSRVAPSRALARRRSIASII